MVEDGKPLWGTVLREMSKNSRKAHQVDMNAEIVLSPLLTMDPKTEQFVGDHAESANRFLKREYRGPRFVVPENRVG